MLGLNGTLDQLARYRRRWEALAARARQAPLPLGADPGRLTEIEGFGSNPGNLRLLVHLPAALPEPAPLVVVLHGCTQSAADYDRGAGWSALADRHGFALLYPEQRAANNAHGCFNWFLPGDTARDQGEALSIRQMIERLAGDHRLDRRRVFVTGLSAGGAMAAALLAAYPEVFAGGAIIAGLPHGAATDVRSALDAMFQGVARPAPAWGDRVRAASPHRGPWPTVSIWHGTADTVVTPLNAAELAKQWTDVHGLPLAWSVEERARGHLRRVWRNRWGEALVTLDLIEGMGHGVPIDPHAVDPGRRCGAAGPYMLDAGIASTGRIAQAWGLTGPAPAAAEPPPVAFLERTLRALGLRA